MSITITVTLTPPAFVIGERVITTANLNVYATASTSGTILGHQAVGSLGTVIGGPITTTNFVWWNIDYDVGADGWSIQDYLAAVSPIPTLTLTATPPSITSGGFNSHVEQHQRHIMYRHRLHRRRDVRYCDRLSDCLTNLLHHLHRRGWNGEPVDNYYSICTAT